MSDNDFIKPSISLISSVGHSFQLPDRIYYNFRASRSGGLCIVRKRRVTDSGVPKLQSESETRLVIKINLFHI